VSEGRCGTCAHWAEGAQAALYPSADPAFGTCQRIGDQDRDLLGGERSTPLAFANNGDGTVSSWLETKAEFGCVEHEKVVGE
jgi:hypothetical protein